MFEIDAPPDLQSAVDQLRKAMSEVFSAGVAQLSKEKAELVMLGVEQHHMRVRFVVDIGGALKVTCSAIRTRTAGYSLGDGEEVLSLFEMEGPPQRFFWASVAPTPGSSS